MKFIAKAGRTLPTNPTIILGIPSFGNLGQMAVDSLISTLASEKKVEQLGILQSDWVSPVVGYEEFSEDWGRILCMPLEVYSVIETSFVFIQQRAPCIAVAAAEHRFAEELYEFLYSMMTPRHLLVICGASFQFNESEELLRSNRLFEIRSNDSTNEISNYFPGFHENLTRIENRIPWSTIEELCAQKRPIPRQLLSQNEITSGSSLEELVRNLLPGSPLVGWLMVESIRLGREHPDMKLWVLGKYCREGNNVDDSIDLAMLIASLTRILGDVEERQMRLRCPKSWDHLLGLPLPSSSISMF